MHIPTIDFDRFVTFTFTFQETEKIKEPDRFVVSLRTLDGSLSAFRYYLRNTLNIYLVEVTGAESPNRIFIETIKKEDQSSELRKNGLIALSQYRNAFVSTNNTHTLTTAGWEELIFDMSDLFSIRLHNLSGDNRAVVKLYGEFIPK